MKKGKTGENGYGEVRVAIVGAGKCASSLVRGVPPASTRTTTPGV